MNLAGRAFLALREFAGARRRLRRLRGARLEEWQERHGVAAAEHALAHSAFWRARAGHLGAARWREWPVVEKADVVAEFDAFNTRGIERDAAVAFALRAEAALDHRTSYHGYTVGLSSGTSGHRSLTILDEREQAGFVGFMLARMLDGALSFSRRRVAFFMRSNSQAYEASRSPFIDYRFFDLSLSDDEIAAPLSALDPHILLAPPAMLGAIAALVDAGRLSLRPRVVFSVAEVLEPQQRAQVERALGVVVRDVYHTSEGLIGVSCREGRMHLQEDIAHFDLEPLGEGRFTPIQTQFFRKVLPVMRYRMNDVVVLDDRPCPCGSSFRVLARVEGRCDDVFWVPGADGGFVRVFPDAVRAAILATDNVRDYRADQLAPDRVRISIEPAGPVDVGALVARVKERLGAGVAVEVVNRIDTAGERGKKLARVRRRFALDALDVRSITTSTTRTA